MNPPFPSQDGFYFSPGYASLVTRANEGTQEVSYAAGCPHFTHYESGENPYDGTHVMVSDIHISDLSSMVFAAPARTANGDVGAGQPAPSSVYAPSSNARNLSTNTLVIAAALPASNIAPLAPVIQATTQRRFQCPICPNNFDRFTRAEACQNHHLGWKPHVCQGACGITACNAAYGSIENLHRHVRPLAQRKVNCPYCSRLILKQNISRHKKSCV